MTYAVTHIKCGRLEMKNYEMFCKFIILRFTLDTRITLYSSTVNTLLECWTRMNLLKNNGRITSTQDGKRLNSCLEHKDSSEIRVPMNSRNARGILSARGRVIWIYDTRDEFRSTERTVNEFSVRKLKNHRALHTISVKGWTLSNSILFLPGDSSGPINF